MLLGPGTSPPPTQPWCPHPSWAQGPGLTVVIAGGGRRHPIVLLGIGEHLWRREGRVTPAREPRPSPPRPEQAPRAAGRVPGARPLEFGFLSHRLARSGILSVRKANGQTFSNARMELANADEAREGGFPSTGTRWDFAERVEKARRGDGQWPRPRRRQAAAKGAGCGVGGTVSPGLSWGTSTDPHLEWLAWRRPGTAAAAIGRSRCREPP